MSTVNANRLARSAGLFAVFRLLVLAPGLLAAEPNVAHRDAPTTLVEIVVARPGDLVSRIARRSQTTTRKILRLNPGLSERHLREGDALLVERPISALPDPAPAYEVARGPRGRRQVALTFDAAWVHEGQLETLLDTIDRLKAPATFFVTGIFMREQPDGVARIVERGHRVHNHSWSHPHMTGESDERIAEELLRLEDAVASATQGAETTRPWWRPPYGDRDERVLTAGGAAGFDAVVWTVDSRDWLTSPPATAESIYLQICERPFERNLEGDPDPLDGAIVLMHVDGKPTPEALERIVPELRKRGYVFVTLEELLRP